MTPAAIFTRCGHALCGDGPRWKEQFAAMLGVRTNSVDNMAKGTSRVPAGVWRDAFSLLEKRRDEIDAVLGWKESAITIAELGTQRLTE